MQKFNPTNLAHRNENKIKIEFTVHLEVLDGLTNEFEGSSFFVELKRGMKSSGHKIGQPVVAKDKKVTFKEALTMAATFYQHKTTKKLTDKKEIAIIVKEVFFFFQTHFVGCVTDVGSV